jgi:3-oxoacyl-[acyl-carrier protein] reductase
VADEPDDSRATQSSEAGSRARGKRERVALVTGASRGIGAAIARVLARDGWAVGVNYRADRTGAARVVDQIVEAGGRATALEADVTDPAAPDQLFGALEAEHGGPVLALVNNAGVSRDDLVPTLGDEEWSTVIETDLNAAFRMTRRALVPMMRARHGRIVNVSSVVGLRANPGQSNYAAAKAGLIALTKNAAVEVARRGVTINAVAPGWIDTDMTAGVSKELLAAVPARRAGTPEEVAACVRFLVSDEASYVTGAVLSVDGGLAA